MQQPHIFSISSSQLKRNELPSDTNNFNIEIEVEIREPDEDDIQTFYLYVVSPS